MTYIQLIQYIYAVNSNSHLSPIRAHPHASFLTSQIRVDLKTCVSDKLNKRHLATTFIIINYY